MMGENTVIVTICVAYFLVMIGTGIYASRKNKKASDFLVAGRRLNTPMTAITLAAVQIGVGIVLSSATNGYNDGVMAGNLLFHWLRRRINSGRASDGEKAAPGGRLCAS